MCGDVWGGGEGRVWMLDQCAVHLCLFHHARVRGQSLVELLVVGVHGRVIDAQIGVLLLSVHPAHSPLYNQLLQPQMLLRTVCTCKQSSMGFKTWDRLGGERERCGVV